MHPKRVVRSVGLLFTVCTGVLFMAPMAGSPGAWAQAAASSPSSNGSGPGGVAALTPAQAAALSINVTDRVIVVLKDQISNLPDTPANTSQRAAAVKQEQSPFLTELQSTHATGVIPYSVINGIAATVSPGEAQRLAANPAVASVVKDQPIPVADSTPTIPKAGTGPSGSSGSLASACAANGAVQLNPQALASIHAASATTGTPSAQGLGYTGAGVKVGFIADGLDIDNPDFIRANGQPVFVDYQDFSGTGTSAPTDGGEAFLDASSIAAQGEQVYNLQDFDPSLTTPCNIRILGVAPGASLVGLNVFGSSDFAYDSVFLAAINYAVNVDHVNVLNESFGDNPFPDQGSLDLTRMADDAAVAAGVTVTVSSGDAGPTDTIGSPATDPSVISAGASTTYRAYAQSGIGGITFPGLTGWLNNNISALTSSGFDQTGGTVDVVAPGDLNWALCTPDPALYAACTNELGEGSSVELSGGTSEAAPLTAGTAALVIQAYEESHGGTAPSPATVKQIIVSTAQDIAAPADQQGAGLIDAYAAVEAAASYPGATTAATGHALIDSATQLNAVAPVSTGQRFTETVTNTGRTAQTVALSSRTLSPYKAIVHTTVQLADATDDVAEVQFTVPPGQARLNGSIAYVAAGPSTDFAAGDNLSLITPTGQLAEYSLPQGAGNYGNAQVADPAPGTWTALIFGEPSADGGSVGPVQFSAASATWGTFGTLSTSSLTLTPGGSQSFTFSVRTPSQPGDVDGAIVLTSNGNEPSFAATTTIPVTLRSLIATPDPSTTVTTNLTGGNGRQFNTGQTVYYQVSVPSGLPELNASISTPNAANTFLATLLDPVTGEAASTAASGIPAIGAVGGSGITPEAGVQLHVLNPDPGLWTLAVNFYNQVSGTALSQPITITLNQTPVPATAPTLPDAASSTLPAGQPTTVDVSVTNSGSTPEAYFVDARLNQSAQLNLAALTTSQVTVPIDSTNLPLYMVPTHTTSVTASATAPSPIYFDYWWAFGDPDLISTSSPLSGSASGTFNADPVVAGMWGITPFQDGPDGTTGDTPVTAQTSYSVTTQAFDPAVTAPSGDLWLLATNPGALLSPYVVAPGQTVTIPVTITPSGAPGSTVSGVLYVDDVTSIAGPATWNELTPNVLQGGDLAALQYSYTIGATPR
jgi:hypothetical protein